MYNKIRFDTFMLMCFFMITILGLSACDSDEKITQEPPSQTYVKKAKEILAGDIVLSTRATMNGVDKTLLKSGCPTKFNFSKCATKIMQLNSWEQDEYPGDGWIKFVGTDGNVTTSGDDAEDNQEGSGARVDGYLNVNTNQIEFIVDYNMMNVRTETFLQTIDKTRIDRFKEEFAQYEKDLEEAKKDQGKA